jgi:hypothetical protein
MEGQTICDVKIIMLTIASLFEKYNIPIYTKIDPYLQPLIMTSCHKNWL